MKRSLMTIAIIAALAGCNSSNDELDDGSTFTLQLLHVADMDGSNATALSNAGNFASLVSGFTSQYPENTLFLSSGDNYIPGSRYEAAKDNSMSLVNGIKVPGVARADIAMLNAMGLQASAVGNHDLDGGSAEFASIINKDGDYPGALFPYLSSNMDFSTDTNTVDLVVPSGQVADTIPNSLTQTTVIEVNGHKIGIVGITTPTNDDITSTDNIAVYPENDSIEDLAVIVQAQVDRLTHSGIDKVIALAHMQSIRFEKQLAGLLKGVDIIVAGGSNTLLANDSNRLWDGDIKAENYPIMLNDADGKDVAIVNVDADYKYLGRLVVSFDTNGDLIASSIDPNASGSFITDDQMVASIDGSTANTEVEAIVDAVNNVIIASEQNIIGHTDVYLNGTRGYVRTEETNLGNLTADANLWYAQLHDAQVQISLKNGGGIRADIGYSEYPAGSIDPNELQYYPPASYPLAGKGEGDISQYDVQSALAFNNSLAIVDLTADELWDILEYGVAGVENISGGFTHIGGMCIEYDGSRTARAADPITGDVTTPGQRIRKVIVDTNGDNTCGPNDELVVSDGVVVVNNNYKAVTLSYLSLSEPYPCTDNGNGGCSNQVMLEDDGVMTVDPQQSNFAATGTEQDALAEYLQAFHTDENAPYLTKDSVDGGLADTRIIRLD
ncbi:MAG: bifunctional metallophosphatase/5'-nucleotidase [Vibrio gallaecicus]